MYISKLGALGQDFPDDIESGDWGTFPELPLPSGSGSGPTQSTDWINLVRNAISTYGDIERAKAVQPPQAPQIVPSYPTSSAVPGGVYTQRPLFSPFSGTLGNGGTILIGAAVLAVGAYFALSK